MKKDFENDNRKTGFVGMRVIKTVIAVYICFLISFIRDGLPFYSAIAAILCMQNNHGNSFEVAKNRIIGTLIGGAFGFIAIMLVKYVNIELFGYIHYLGLSLFLIPIIYTNVFLKVNNSTYISCVVFFSITIAHGGDLSPMYFTINRMVDTLIGIAVSLITNIIL